MLSYTANNWRKMDIQEFADMLGMSTEELKAIDDTSVEESTVSLSKKDESFLLMDDDEKFRMIQHIDAEIERKLAEIERLKAESSE